MAMSNGTSNKPRLHLDEDASAKPLYRVLRERGFDVTRTPNDWIAKDASDEQQLLEASRRGRILFTYNVQHFIHLAKLYPDHAGIILAHQTRWNLSRSLRAFDRLLRETSAEEWRGQVRWLKDWLR